MDLISLVGDTRMTCWREILLTEPWWTGWAASQFGIRLTEGPVDVAGSLNGQYQSDLVIVLASEEKKLELNQPCLL